MRIELKWHRWSHMWNSWPWMWEFEVFMALKVQVVVCWVVMW